MEATNEQIMHLAKTLNEKELQQVYKKYKITTLGELSFEQANFIIGESFPTKDEEPPIIDKNVSIKRSVPDKKVYISLSAIAVIWILYDVLATIGFFAILGSGLVSNSAIIIIIYIVQVVVQNVVFAAINVSKNQQEDIHDMQRVIIELSNELDELKKGT